MKPIKFYTKAKRAYYYRKFAKVCGRPVQQRCKGRFNGRILYKDLFFCTWFKETIMHDYWGPFLRLDPVIMKRFPEIDKELKYHNLDAAQGFDIDMAEKRPLKEFALAKSIYYLLEAQKLISETSKQKK